MRPSARLSSVGTPRPSAAPRPEPRPARVPTARFDVRMSSMPQRAGNGAGTLLDGGSPIVRPTCIAELSRNRGRVPMLSACRPTRIPIAAVVLALVGCDPIVGPRGSEEREPLEVPAAASIPEGTAFLLPITADTYIDVSAQTDG